MESFVSIIISCRNEESFIGRCLDSIIANQYPKEKMEILVVDGLSKDRTREIIKNYLSAIWRQQSSGNQSLASIRNREVFHLES